MVPAKFSLTENQLRFLEQFKTYGFKDKSEMVRTALERLHQELEQQSLKESAELYAQLYEEDEELRQLAEASLSDWAE